MSSNTTANCPKNRADKLKTIIGKQNLLWFLVFGKSRDSAIFKELFGKIIHLIFYVTY